MVQQVNPRDPERITRARSEADARPIDYPYGSGEAEVIALLAGDKPMIRQLLPADRCLQARARFEEWGFSTAETSALPQLGPPSVRVVFVARDEERTREAVACEHRLDHAGLGRLLGFPACCVAAFAADPPWISTHSMLARALARTRSPLKPRLNVLDLAVFHYLAWIPCGFDCEPSAAYASNLASHLLHRRPGIVPGMEPGQRCPPDCRHQRFVERIDEALAAHRLMVVDGVQLSMTGRLERGVVQVERVWPTARDRHAGAGLDPDAREAVARLVAAIEEAPTIGVEGDALVVGGRRLLRSEELLLAPFGGAADRAAGVRR